MDAHFQGIQWSIHLRMYATLPHGLVWRFGLQCGIRIPVMKGIITWGAYPYVYGLVLPHTFGAFYTNKFLNQKPLERMNTTVPGTFLKFNMEPENLFTPGRGYCFYFGELHFWVPC